MNKTEDIVRQQTIEFKKEIEKRFIRSKQNHTYIFNKDMDHSDDDSLDSLRHQTLYDLNSQNTKQNTNQNQKLESTLPKQPKTTAILLKLLQQKNNNGNQKQLAKQKASFHSGLDQLMNRSTTQRGNVSFYQPTRVSTRSLSKNGTQRLRTEGSVLRDTTNMLISPKLVKSPVYSKYINLDSYLNSTKNQYSRVTTNRNKLKKSFEFNKMTNFSLGN